MKLNINFITDLDYGDEYVAITDDRGHLMPGVRGVKVEKNLDRVTIATVELVVDRKNVTLGDVTKGENNAISK